MEALVNFPVSFTKINANNCRLFGSDFKMEIKTCKRKSFMIHDLLVTNSRSASNSIFKTSSWDKHAFNSVQSLYETPSIQTSTNSNGLGNEDNSSVIPVLQQCNSFISRMKNEWKPVESANGLFGKQVDLVGPNDRSHDGSEGMSSHYPCNLLTLSHLGNQVNSQPNLCPTTPPESSPVHQEATPILKKLRKARTAFTDYQLSELEQSFDRQKYLAVQDRMELANRLGLSDMQVKTWYQNRRTKWKRQSAVGLELLAEAGNLAAVQRLVHQNPLWFYNPTAQYIFNSMDYHEPSEISSSDVEPTLPSFGSLHPDTLANLSGTTPIHTDPGYDSLNKTLQDSIRRSLTFKKTHELTSYSPTKDQENPSTLRGESDWTKYGEEFPRSRDLQAQSSPIPTNPDSLGCQNRLLLWPYTMYNNPSTGR